MSNNKTSHSLLITFMNTIENQLYHADCFRNALYYMYFKCLIVATTVGKVKPQSSQKAKFKRFVFCILKYV